jgi:hypothetical protein
MSTNKNINDIPLKNSKKLKINYKKKSNKKRKLSNIGLNTKNNKVK